MKLHAQTREGQSAIEYLTTYGWALLAIIIVGAVLVQMGVFDQCQTTQPRFSGQQAGLDTWTFTDTNQMSFVVQAINKDLEDVGVVLDVDDDGAYDFANATTTDVSAGQTLEVTLNASAPARLAGSGGSGDAFSSGECASATLVLNYTISGISQNTLSTGSGTLSGPVP